MSVEQSVTESLFIGTANQGFAQQAQEEVRRLISGARFSYLAPMEVFLMTLPQAAEKSVNIIKQNEPIFLRHIQPVHKQIHISKTNDDFKQVQTLISQQSLFQKGQKVSIQIRKSADTTLTYSLGEMRASLENVFNEVHHVETVARFADYIVSIYISADILYYGVSYPADNLSDWSGGAIRFKKEENQVSRAKFKLLEAEIAFSLDFTTFHKALDIGAAPGGWTSLLLERDLAVTAVDPATLHPLLKDHPRLTYLQKNASDVSFVVDEFDLLVCDMSWSPRQMSKLIIQLIPALQAQGVAIITAKLMHKNAFQAVREIKASLEPYLQLMQAKHLFHNREELTLYFVKKSMMQ